MRNFYSLRFIIDYLEDTSADTPEDLLIQEAHRAYGDLIYFEPWYKFPFLDYAGRVWGDTPFFGANFIRKLERKLMATGEFGFKAMYAKLIGFRATTAYEASDGLVTMHIVANADDLKAIDPRITVLKDFGDGDLVVTLPRWGGFSEIMPKLAAAGVRFVEFSGNDEIVMTTVEDAKSNNQPDSARFLFSSMVISPSDRKRSAYVIRVEDLDKALGSLKPNEIKLEHVFDF